LFSESRCADNRVRGIKLAANVTAVQDAWRVVRSLDRRGGGFPASSVHRAALGTDGASHHHGPFPSNKSFA